MHAGFGGGRGKVAIPGGGAVDLAALGGIDPLLHEHRILKFTLRNDLIVLLDYKVYQDSLQLKEHKLNLELFESLHLSRLDLQGVSCETFL